MDEMRQMASEFEKSANCQNEEILLGKQSQFKAEKKMEDMALDFNQKEKQPTVRQPI